MLAEMLTPLPSVVKLPKRLCGSSALSALGGSRRASAPRNRNPPMRIKPLLVAVASAGLMAGALSSPAVAVQPSAPAPAEAPAVFAHPGVGVSRAQLDFVKAKVQAGAQPWTSAYNQAKNSAYGSLSRTPAPRAVVECG